VYHKGWAENGKIKSPHTALGYQLELRYQGNPPNGAALFWSHYSYLGLDPRELKDQYADYWKENTNQTLINYTWCVTNPKKFRGYGKNNWGLTASYSTKVFCSYSGRSRRPWCNITQLHYHHFHTPLKIWPL
jgi:hypothetical protein